MTTIARYNDLKATGLSQGQIVNALRAEGASFDEAVELCWKAETGKKSPDFKNDHRARRAWDSRAERAYLQNGE